MKKLFIYIGIIFIVFFLMIMITFNKPAEMEVQTFERVITEKIEGDIRFKEKIRILSPVDDFVERILVSRGQEVAKNEVLIELEKDEEEFQLSKAKKELAVSILNAGKAIQEEKRNAVRLAEKNLDKTTIRAPIDAIIIDIPVITKLFVEKGTPLIVLAEKDTRLLTEIDEPTAKILKKADYITYRIAGSDIREGVIEKPVTTETEDGLYLQLPVLSNNIKSALGDKLFCELKILYNESGFSWIPDTFVQEGRIQIADNGYIPVEILDKKDDLYLVKGIESGTTLLGQKQ